MQVLLLQALVLLLHQQRRQTKTTEPHQLLVLLLLPVPVLRRMKTQEPQLLPSFLPVREPRRM